MPRRARVLRGPRTLTLADQVVSSLTNFLPGLYAAKQLSPADFGIFALLQMAYIIFLSMGRAAFSEVAILGHGGQQARLAAVDCMTLSSLAVIAPAGVVLILTTHSPPMATTAAVVGIAIMLVQDALRLGEIGAGRPGLALLNDALWLSCTTLGLVLVTVHAIPTSPWTLSIVWAGGALAGVIAGAMTMNWRGPRPRRARTFISSHRRQSAAFLGDWTIKTGAVQLATYAIGLVGGITTVASIRAAQLLLGPMNILFSGSTLVLMPRVVELRSERVNALPRASRSVSLALGGAAAALGLAIAITPKSLLRLAVGPQAEALPQFIIPLSLSLAASGLITGSNVALRALHERRSLLLARIATASATLVGGLVAYAISENVLLTLWGLAIGALVGAPPWDLLLLRAVRQQTDPIGAHHGRPAKDGANASDSNSGFNTSGRTEALRESRNRPSLNGGEPG